MSFLLLTLFRAFPQELFAFVVLTGVPRNLFQSVGMLWLTELGASLAGINSLGVR